HRRARGAARLPIRRHLRAARVARAGGLAPCAARPPLARERRVTLASPARLRYLFPRYGLPLARTAPPPDPDRPRPARHGRWGGRVPRPLEAVRARAPAQHPLPHAPRLAPLVRGRVGPRPLLPSGMRARGDGRRPLNGRQPTAARIGAVFPIRTVTGCTAGGGVSPSRAAGQNRHSTPRTGSTGKTPSGWRLPSPSNR